jgi:hypothetical protein
MSEVGKFVHLANSSDLSSVNPREQQVLLPRDHATAGAYVISKKAAGLSALVKDMLGDEMTSGELVPLTLKNVEGNVLKYVVEYLSHHAEFENEKPPSKPINEFIETLEAFKPTISEWDYNFLYTDLVKNCKEEEHDLLTQVTMAANYMRIEDLLSLCCAAFAMMIRSRDAKEVRKLFKVPGELTPEQEERIRKEHSWYEDA